MEHIFNIAFSVDDEGIEKKATDYCVKKIYEDMKGKVIEDGYFSGRLTSQAEKIVERWMNDHKDEIIEASAVKIAEKIARTKMMRERVGELL